jgi:hypothetical protein
MKTPRAKASLTSFGETLERSRVFNFVLIAVSMMDL